MVSDKSFQADFGTDLREMSVCVFCNSGEIEKNHRVVQQNTNMLVFLKHICEKPLGASPRLEKLKSR